MNAKDELRRYKYVKNKVDEALEEYRNYQDRATKITAIVDDMPHASNAGDKVGNNAIEMANIAKQYETFWLEAEKERMNLIYRINELDEPYRTILHKRYVQEKSLETIASEMNYNYTYICELHGQALINYENVRSNPKTSE